MGYPINLVAHLKEQNGLKKDLILKKLFIGDGIYDPLVLRKLDIV